LILSETRPRALQSVVGVARIQTIERPASPPVNQDMQKGSTLCSGAPVGRVVNALEQAFDLSHVIEHDLF
jgi:hypothetical protein